MFKNNQWETVTYIRKYKTSGKEKVTTCKLGEYSFWLLYGWLKYISEDLEYYEIKVNNISMIKSK